MKDPKLAITVNWQQYASPEQRYCPAGVYEFVGENTEKHLQINATNCIHCKACDIKDHSKILLGRPQKEAAVPIIVKCNEDIL